MKKTLLMIGFLGVFALAGCSENNEESYKEAISSSIMSEFKTASSLASMFVGENNPVNDMISKMEKSINVVIMDSEKISDTRHKVLAEVSYNQPDLFNPTQMKLEVVTVEVEMYKSPEGVFKVIKTNQIQ